MAIFTKRANSLRAISYYENVLGLSDPTKIKDIWFGFSKVRPWDDDPTTNDNNDATTDDVEGETNPPKPIESGYTDETKAGFFRTRTQEIKSFKKEFAGFKRAKSCMLVVEDENLGEISFAGKKWRVCPPGEYDISYPTHLYINVEYEYGDFDKEYTVRQIGVFQNLKTGSYNLDELFPSGKDGLNCLYDGCVSANGSVFQLNELIPNLNSTTPDTENHTDFGILHFYENMPPNYRFSYQVDMYAFMISFENAQECVCDNIGKIK